MKKEQLTKNYALQIIRILAREKPKDPESSSRHRQNWDEIFTRLAETFKEESRAVKALKLKYENSQLYIGLRPSFDEIEKLIAKNPENAPDLRQLASKTKVNNLAKLQSLSEVMLMLTNFVLQYDWDKKSALGEYRKFTKLFDRLEKIIKKS
jgi:hypothetical protein